MISYINEALFRQNSVYKDFFITDNDSIALTNNDIYEEGIELSQSINTEDDLRFGSCVTSTLKFTTSDISNSYIGKCLTFTIVLEGDDTNPLLVGTYRVVEETLTADRTKKEIVAKDSIYEINNAEVASWYSSLTFPMTLLQFRNSFFSYMGIEQKTATLVNDSMTIERTIAVSVLSGADVIQAICEINGVFGRITNDNKFEYISLGDTPVYTITTSLGISCTYEDYNSEPIDKIIIRQENNDVGVQYGSGTNILVIQGNFLVYGKGTDDLTPVVENLYSVISGISYKPFEIECIGNPCVEVGDMITVQTRTGTIFNTYVLNRTLKGGQALRDVITAEGNEERLNEINSPQSQWLQLLGKSNTFERTLEATTSQIQELGVAVTTVTQTASDLGVQIENLQEQIDGTGGYYEREGAPTLLNYPYWDFTSAFICDGTKYCAPIYTNEMVEGGEEYPHFYYSEQDRKDNMRALCIDLTNGNGYRFVIENNEWLWKQIADSDFSILFNQITELSATVEGISTRVSDVSIDVQNHESRITTNESNIEQHTTDISAKVSKTDSNQSSTFGWTLDTMGFDIWNSSGSVFKVNTSGVEIIGKVTATSGYIGTAQSGFAIGSTYIRNGMNGMVDNTHNGIYVGTDGIALGKGKFKVTNTGYITASSGIIGGWTLGTDRFSLLDNENDEKVYLRGYASGSAQTTSVAELGSESVIINANNISSFSPNAGVVELNANGGMGEIRLNAMNEVELNAGSNYIRFSNGYMVTASQDLEFYASNNEGNYGVKLGVTDSTWAFSPVVDGYLRLGTPNHKWNQIYSTNSVISTSDRNEKRDIVELDSEILDFVLKLKPVSYKFKEGTRTHLGLVAQEVKDTMNELGMSDNDFAGFCKDVIDGKEIYGLRYEEFIPAIMKVVQMQQKEIEILKDKVG